MGVYLAPLELAILDEMEPGVGTRAVNDALAPAGLPGPDAIREGFEEKMYADPAGYVHLVENLRAQADKTRPPLAEVPVTPSC